MALHGFDVDLGPDALVLHLRGLTALGAVRRRVEVPYRQIAAVEIGPLATRDPLLWRLGGLAAGALRFGTFRRGSDWLFLAVRTRGDVVHLRLDGHGPERVRFAEVVVSADDPHALAAQIRDRRSGPEASA